VVARRQLLALGVTPTVIRERVRRGTLALLHRGVWAVGHDRLRREGRRLAAVLACGPGAALSHREAAALHGLSPSSRSQVDVTTVRRGRSEQAGIRLHRTASLDVRELTAIDGIPVTTVARTLVDLAGVVPSEHVAKALREAEHLRVVDAAELELAMRRMRTRRGHGHATLRAVLDEHRRRGTQLTRSPLEDRFLALLDDHGVPRPRTNVDVGGVEVDAHWPAQRLVVELDGWARHRDRRAFQRDRMKGNALTQNGYRLLRFTHDDVVRRPGATAAQIHALLADA
jgi:predicted transcriptional regulator of viral defense system